MRIKNVPPYKYIHSLINYALPFHNLDWFGGTLYGLEIKILFYWSWIKIFYLITSISDFAN